MGGIHIQIKLIIRLGYQFQQLLISLIFEMCEVSQEQINCIFDISQGDDIKIFDQDNWISQEQARDKELVTQKDIIIKAQQNQDSNCLNVHNSNSNTINQKSKHQNQVISKIDKQLENSKTNFFKVNIVKKEPNSKKQDPKSLKKIQISEKNLNRILKQGYMDKNTDSFIFRWKTRYFAITSEKLFFFEDQKKQKVIGCVNFKLLSIELKKNEKGCQITLDFLGQTQNITLKCQNQKQFKQWVNIIEQVLQYQSKEKKLMLKTFIKPLYSFQDSITEKQFLRNAETGDVLLFYTRHTGAKIQRFLTNSDFDHVAMVIKFGHNQLMVFQSNQTYGVSIFQWHQYIRYFDLYQKVTIRKLHSARKQQLHHSLLNFTKKNLGKKYDITALKLLKLESDFNWDQTKQQDQTRGFFCSELIAKAYKTVGLIDKKKFSGRYWPVDFSERGSIQLKNGAYLGSQQSIILGKHIKNRL